MNSRRKTRWIILIVISMCVSLFKGIYSSQQSRKASWTSAARSASSAEGQKESAGAAWSLEKQYRNRDSEESVAQEQQGETAAAQEQQDETAAAVWEQPEEISLSADGKGELISDEDAQALQHIKKYMVEGMSGNGGSYPVYAPEGSAGSGGSLNYSDHGIFCLVLVIDGGDKEMPYYMMDSTMEGQQENMEVGGYSNVWVGKVVENGEDRYAVVTAMDTDVSGEPCWIRRLVYLDVQEPGVGVLWQMDVIQMFTDEMTETILEQWGQCYGIDMESFTQKRE